MAPDEPIANLFEAARLAPDVQFAFTGNQKKLDAGVLARAPANVRFTGFLPEEGYWALLNTSDAIIDLTLMDHCLVCGAYEAAAAGKPAILSGNDASRELFAGTAIFSGHSPAEIAAAIAQLRAGAVPAEQVAAAARQLRSTWARDVASLRDLFLRLARPAVAP
jgi:glycosyltransferase involved in cell wall biosynthesis